LKLKVDGGCQYGKTDRIIFPVMKELELGVIVRQRFWLRRPAGRHGVGVWIIQFLNWFIATIMSCLGRSQLR
jgi:hypothetical protein